MFVTHGMELNVVIRILLMSAEDQEVVILTWVVLAVLHSAPIKDFVKELMFHHYQYKVGNGLFKLKIDLLRLSNLNFASLGYF